MVSPLVSNRIGSSSKALNCCWQVSTTGRAGGGGGAIATTAGGAATTTGGGGGGGATATTAGGGAATTGAATTGTGGGGATTTGAGGGTGTGGATTGAGVLQTVEVKRLAGDLMESTQPTAGSTKTVPPLELQTFSVNGEVARRVAPTDVQVPLAVPELTTTLDAQVVVAPPENTWPGVQTPFNGETALRTVSRHSVATKAGLPPKVIPALQLATAAYALWFSIEQVDLVQAGDVAAVTPGVQTLPMKAVFWTRLQRTPAKGGVAL